MADSSGAPPPPHPDRARSPPALRATCSHTACAEVSSRYLSFCVDLGQIAEPTRFWNPDGAGESRGVRPSFDFSVPRLRNLCRALAPAYLRIGGTEADRVYYALTDAGEEHEPPLLPPPHYGSVLTADHLRGLRDFADEVGLHVSFALNAGWGPRAGSIIREDGSASAWRCVQARALMRFARAEGIPIRVWELGNEPNAWPLFHNPPLFVSPEHHAEDVAVLARARDEESPGSRISAPGTAWWPAMGEVPTFLPPSIFPMRRPRLAQRFLPRVAAVAAERKLAGADILTWHYYPGLSDRSILARGWPAAGPIGITAAIVAVFATFGASVVIEHPMAANIVAPLSIHQVCGGEMVFPDVGCVPIDWQSEAAGSGQGPTALAFADYSFECSPETAAVLHSTGKDQVVAKPPTPSPSLAAAQSPSPPRCRPPSLPVPVPTSARALVTAAVASVVAVAAALVALVCLALRLLVVPIDQETLRKAEVLDTCLQFARQVAMAARTQAGERCLVDDTPKAGMATLVEQRPDREAALSNGKVKYRAPVVESNAREGAPTESKDAENRKLHKAPACWLGETGSAQVGGQPNVSGTWAATPWWLDQLGLLAKEGHEVQCRQTLAGADYGLLTEDSLEPTPDYWASLLWRHTMGTKVYRVALPRTAPRTLRVYCHSAPEGFDLGKRAEAFREAARTFLIINLGQRPIKLLLQRASAESKEVELAERRVGDTASDGVSAHMHKTRPPRSPTGQRWRAADEATHNVHLSQSDESDGDRDSLSHTGARSEPVSTLVRVLSKWLLDAPSLDSRTVLINGILPEVAEDGTSQILHAAIKVAHEDDQAPAGEVVVPAGAVLFAMVA